MHEFLIKCFCFYRIWLGSLQFMKLFCEVIIIIYYWQACTKHSHASIVFPQWSKIGFFAPQGRHDNNNTTTYKTYKIAPINVIFGTVWSDSPCQISHLLGQKCGSTAPKTVKISNFCLKFASHGRLVCIIITKFTAFVRVHRQLVNFNLVTFWGQTTNL